ncbi:MAG: HAD-IIIA family hydrolase [Bacteroidota bacterium]|nr:HAD-IIIA family hydrolase [Bacteroidota bacterium]MDP4232644.1 HAD-IIIA family hydrolase [Bacteroidota bacterium]MDP4243896.1 HAD-IIIA family hydrolase [Bacteroidota bacterium]MDP4288435.1 HAD-IIIA family hydrolase [Bacteroidota bacterium]
MRIDSHASGHDAKRRAIFFDRDGVINTRILGGYVRHPLELDLSPEIASVLQAVKNKGYLAIIITNQRGVGLGLMTEGALHSVHDDLQSRLLQQTGVKFDDILYATSANSTDPRRKPSPAMLLEAAQTWNIDLENSWMIGDSMSDIEAGQRAGTKTAYLVTVHSEEIPKATKVIHTLEEILKFL